MKHEPRGKFRDVNGWTSGNFICLGQEKNKAGLFQVRYICWDILHESFSCHSLYPDNRDTNKELINNLNEIFLQGTDSWDHNIPVSLRVDPAKFRFEDIPDCFGSGTVISKNNLEGLKVTIFNRFRCNLLKTKIKFEGT